MYLGVRAVIAGGFARIHRQNLINFGILPLLFADPADYDAMEQGDALLFHGLRGQLAVGKPVEGELVKADGTKKKILFNHPLSGEDIVMILAGGRLNCP